ncbi:DUF4838 domain-containing protein [Niabella hirudinis]|uniref:DUF4838 domain-containing protein n=1 Tax=Niabella hirudinis TaxID=1285929 RepID=UPI003EB78E5E
MTGFHWYGPGNNWFIKPATLKLPEVPGKWMEPSFRNRSFFGTGGLDFGTIQPYDPGNLYQQKWYDWKRRNRFNADFRNQGHTGQAFYLANKDLLDAHPEWFSGESGKLNGRIRIDQPAAVRAYKDWIRKIYNAATGEFIALGVEPEDGRGGADDPLPARMPAVKNHADKWWWLANEVARDYPENDKHIVITALAYGDGRYNALAPSFPLRKNVYPIIIPYAFQQAYQPDEMVKVWAKRVNGRLGIYDYWNITEWSRGMPQFNIYTIQPKLQFWNKNKIDGVNLETTDAAGPVGHVLWLAGQLQWDVNKNFEQLYDQYLDDCFGKAGPAMRNMFDRWSKNYQDAGEVSLSLNDLKYASEKVAKESPEANRILEMKAYVHFMKLYYEHDGTQESKNRLFNYLYRIHHLMLVQTAAFVGQNYILPLDKGNIVPDGKNIKPVTHDEIERQFKKDLQVARPVYQLSAFNFDLDKVKYVEPIVNTVWRFGGYQCVFYFKAPLSGKISIDVGAETETPFVFSDEDQVLIREDVGKSNKDYTETIMGRSWGMKKFQIPVEKGKRYRLQTSYGFARVKMNTPGIVLFKNPGAEDFDNYAYPVQYFYVPKSATEIIYYDAFPGGQNEGGFLAAPDGKHIQREPTGDKNTYRVPVQPAYRGKLWTANFGHPSWKFKNIPNITSLQKFEYHE